MSIYPQVLQIIFSLNLIHSNKNAIPGPQRSCTSYQDSLTLVFMRLFSKLLLPALWVLLEALDLYKIASRML